MATVPAETLTNIEQREIASRREGARTHRSRRQWVGEYELSNRVGHLDRNVDHDLLKAVSSGTQLEGMTCHDSTADCDAHGAGNKGTPNETSQ